MANLRGLTMRRYHLPAPALLRPGSRWPMGGGVELELLPGRLDARPGRDLCAVVRGHGAPTHRGIDILLLAVMLAEERYRHRPQGGRGAGYYIDHLAALGAWFVEHRDAADAPPMLEPGP